MVLTSVIPGYDLTEVYHSDSHIWKLSNCIGNLCFLKDVMLGYT
jgi:hypothetical protein